MWTKLPHIFINFNQSLSVREKITGLRLKEKSSDEGPSYKFLLLWIVRLIHADPILMLHVCYTFAVFVVAEGSPFLK